MWVSASSLGPAAGPALSGLSPAGRCPMTTAAPSTALATIQPAFTDAERLALAGYRGLTRAAYALDLRPGPAPVRYLVPGPLPGLVHRPPRRHRILRPRPGGPGPGPRDRHPAA